MLCLIKMFDFTFRVYHPEVRREGPEPLPDKAGYSTLPSRSGGDKGLRTSGAPNLGVPLV